MSEVSQLSEMNAVLIASKEDNDRKQKEADDTTAKIADLEKRLEEQVAFTNRYRDTKTAVTGGLRKRVETVSFGTTVVPYAIFSGSIFGRK